MSRCPCEREEEEVACRQCRRIGRENSDRAVRVMTRRQLSTTAKPEKNTKRIAGSDIDVSPEAMREAQRGDVCLQTILDLSDAGPEKPPWSSGLLCNTDIMLLMFMSLKPCLITNLKRGSPIISF